LFFGNNLPPNRGYFPKSGVKGSERFGLSEGEGFDLDNLPHFSYYPLRYYFSNPLARREGMFGGFETPFLESSGMGFFILRPTGKRGRIKGGCGGAIIARRD
jgi:hypothetical protein